METTPLYTIKKNAVQFDSIKITQSEHAADFIRQFYHEDIEVYESFFILLLDRQNKTIGYAKISQGGIFSTVVDVKIIAKYVVDSLASGIILAHNHPSGQLKASNEDIQITNKIKEVLKHFDCVVLDHVILTADSYYSMVDNGAI